MKPLSLLIAASLLSVVPHDTTMRESFDVIEVNNFYSWKQREHENGDIDFVLEPVFTQLLFRRWQEHTGTHEIAAWRMAKDGMQPQFNHALGCWECRWIDSGVDRVIQARTCVESDCDIDKEVSERERFPREKRAELRKPISGKGR